MKTIEEEAPILSPCTFCLHPECCDICPVSREDVPFEPTLTNLERR